MRESKVKFGNSIKLKAKGNITMMLEPDTNDNGMIESISNQEDANELKSAINKELDSLKMEWKTVTLPVVMTLAQLPELKRELEKYHGCRVQLCGSKVEQVDSAALQLLLAFINMPDITVGWIEYSSQLRVAASLLGLSSHLGLPKMTDEEAKQ
jgi:ABC-type transporter Mla MlaB component